MGDLSTIDGLSIYGDDLELNMQSLYRRNNDERDESFLEENKYWYSDSISRQDFNDNNINPIEETKDDFMEEEKSMFPEPKLNRGKTYPISGSLKNWTFDHEYQNSLSAWKSNLNESIDLAQNEDETNL